MGFWKWQPSKKKKREFAAKMREIEEFCDEHDICCSYSKDSYYFSIGEKNYRVSNHSIEKSNQMAYDQLTGQKKRALYHPDGRRADTIYIHASKTRIIEIYNDLVAGYELDGRGNRK